MYARLFTRETRTEQATFWGGWPGESSTAAGSPVTVETSMQLLTVYGCVRLITDSISTLPVDCYRTLADGTTEELPVPMWIKTPTVDLDFAGWCSQVLVSLLLHGNAYIVVLRSSTRGIVELVPLDPVKVVVRRERSVKTYVIDGQVFNGEIVHLTATMMPGSDVGVSPVEAARQSIGLGLATVEYGGNFFEREGNMPGVIEIPTKADPTTMSDLARQWMRKRNKRNRGLPGVLESGMTWKPTGVTNEQAQFLATRQFTAAEIAGQMFLVDPSDLGIPVPGTSLTYANLEQRNIRRVQVTLLPWIIRIEKALSALLAQPRFVKLNVNGLLRGDAAARWATYAQAAQINEAAARTGMPPVLLTDEMRHFEDLNPIKDWTPPTPQGGPNVAA